MTAIADWVTTKADGVGLGPKASRVLEVLKTQPHLAAYASTADLASRAGVNVATVVRTAQALGFTGWPHLRLELRSRYLATLTASELLDEHSGSMADPMVSAFRQDMENLRITLGTVDFRAVHGVAQTISTARKTLVIGSGSFAAPGIQLAHVASGMGMDIQIDRHGGTQLGNAITHLGPSDGLVVFNLWWQPREIGAAVRLASARAVKICLVTDRPNSSIADLSTYVIVVASEGVSAFPSLTPSMAVVHAILAEVARIGGPSVTAALARADAAWASMDIFDESR